VDALVRYLQYPSEELLKACAGSKDERAWAEFIRRFHTVIAGAVLRTARSWGESSLLQLDDLIQDTYLKLCEDDCRLLSSFQPHHENSIYGFLKVVAANVVHDHFKSAQAAKRGAGRAIAEPINIDSVPVNDDSFNRLAQRLQLEQVDRILRQVTAGKDQERKCTIFWLRHRQGFTASEIAAIPSVELTTEGVESVLLRLAIMIRTHLVTSEPHREVKVLKRQNRFRKSGS
jgi:RNA polymerase sigma-70 factor, ECF subfamily